MNVKTTFKKAGRKIVKHGPTIMLVAGIGTGIAATVIACKKTDGFKTIRASAEEKYDEIKACEEKGVTHINGVAEDYTTADARMDRIVVARNLTVGFLKTYWLPLSMGAVSIGLICGSHGIMAKRNAVLSAGLTAATQAFAAYRENVKSLENGEEIDKKCLFGIQDGTIDIPKTDENGEITGYDTEKVTYSNFDLNSPYNFVFDKSNKYWVDPPVYNVDFLNRVQRELNDKLIMNGYLTLNDWCKSLGFKTSSLGQKVGWVRGPHAAEQADQKIDFHFYELNNTLVRSSAECAKEGYYIIANVDGAIDYLIDRIEEDK